jgi:hypothetical protein
MTPSNIVAVKTLAAYLKAEIPELNILEEWPDPKEEMALPTLSILSVGKQEHTHAFPLIHKKIAIEGEELKKKVVYSVADMDIKLQLDLWTDYKAKRDEFYDLIMAAFDKQFLVNGAPTGLSLELEDYHETFARYDQTGYTYLDSSDNGQRQEWRAKIDVLVNHPRLVEKDEFIMAEITLKNEINETADLQDETVNDEEFKIP